MASIWLKSNPDRRYVRLAPNQWVYAGRQRWPDVAVPGARDVTLEEYVRAEALARGVRHPRRAEVPEPLIEGTEFAWLTVRTSLGFFRRDGVYMAAIQSDAWEGRRRTVVGMRAPELEAGFVRQLALAERDLRGHRFRRARLSDRRARLVAHAHTRHGISLGELARCTGLSRTRMQQFVEVGTHFEDGDLPHSRAACLRAVRAAGNELDAATTLLRTAESFRRRRVIEALERDGVTLATVADALELSRARVHEIARTELQPRAEVRG